ncbi:MAG: CBS domain-containing protein [Firmicutes bacterium]|nr:CBS domain-containing protein [Bacillota bacterium]
MFVKNRMTPNPITVNKKTTIAEALEIMRENKIRRLPVMDRGKLVGIVTDRDLSEVSPSPATSLSVFEINYLLAKTRIGDILPKNQTVYTVSPDAYLEEAALLMREHEIGGVPVVDNGQLVGIITETNIFDAFIDIMGLRQEGTRIHLGVEDRPGVLADVTQVIKNFGGNITHIVSYTDPDGVVNLVIRLNKGDSDCIVAELKKQGYHVLSVART